MAITGRFLADFSQFESATQSAGGKLLAFEGNAAKAGTAIKSIETTARASTPVLGSMAAQLAGMFTVGAVVAFGRSVLTAGDSIQKMADQTSLSTGEVQKLMYIAGQSGTSIQSLVGAVQNLQQRLGDDNSGAAGAMARLGINAEAFNKLGTYQQMTTLASAVRGIRDPTEQASVAAALFGKTWKEILPAIKGGMAEVGEQATLMSDDTVKGLDRVGDALKRSQGIATAWGGRVVLAIEGAGFAIGDYLSRFSLSHFGSANSEVLKHETYLAKLEGRVVQGKPPVLALGEAAKGMGMSFEDASKMAKDLDGQVHASIKTHTDVKEAYDKTAASVRDYYNWVGERAIDHEKTVADSLAREAAALRAFYNEMAVLEMNAWKPEPVVDWVEKIEESITVVGTMPAAIEPSKASVKDLATIFNESAGVIIGSANAMSAAVAMTNAQIMQLPRNMRPGENPFETEAEFTQRRNVAGASIPHFAGGGPVMQDGPIYAHAGEYVVPKGGGGSTVINVYGNLLSTKAELARLMEDALVKARTAGGGRIPA